MRTRTTFEANPYASYFVTATTRNLDTGEVSAVEYRTGSSGGYVFAQDERGREWQPTYESGSTYHVAGSGANLLGYLKARHQADLRAARRRASRY